jgi:dihydrofolate reductase
MKSNIYAVMAHDLEGGIGLDNKMPWFYKEDLKRFYKLTTVDNSCVVMGRKTWDSLPKKPLARRTNVILSSTLPQRAEDNVFVVRTMARLEQLMQTYNHVFIIGGANLLDQLMPLVDTLFITRINKVYKCDAFMPAYTHLFNLVQTRDVDGGSLTFEKWKKK